MNGLERKEVLCGPDVPDLEDREARADELREGSEKSEHSPLVVIRMEEEK